MSPLAAIAHKQLFVSPRTKSASGLTSSIIGSIFTNIFPMVSTAVPVAAFKNDQASSI